MEKLLNLAKINTVTENNSKVNYAIRYEKLDMQIEDTERKISVLTRKLAKEDIQETEQLDLESKLQEEKEKLQAYQDARLEVIAVHDEVCEGVRNARNILRVLACVEAPALSKYAIPDLITSEKLVDNLGVCHKLSGYGENGKLSMTKEVREAYKKVEFEIQSLVRENFSVFEEEESEFFHKKNVKFNNTDLGILHEIYVRGTKLVWSTYTDEEGNKSHDYKGLSLATSIYVDVNKKTGERKVKSANFAREVVNLVADKMLIKK